MIRCSRSLIALFGLLAFGSTAIASEEDYLTYSEFISAVEAGTVKSVSIGQFSGITGTRVVGGQERPFRSYGETATANDVLLVRLLNEKGVETSLKKQGDDRLSLLTGGIGLVMLLTPIVILVIVVRISMKVSRVRNELKALSDDLAGDAQDFG